MSGEYVLNQSIFRVPSTHDDEVSLGSYGLYGYGIYGLGDVVSGSAAVDALVNDIDAKLAVQVRPLWGAIDQSPLPADQKALLKAHPLIFMLQSMKIIENLASEIVVEANRMSGKMTRVYGVPGAMIQMDMNPQPDADAKLPTESLRQLMRVLRLVGQFAILMVQVPPILAAATAKVFAKYAVQGGDIVANFVRNAGGRAASEVASLAQNVAKGVQAGAQNVATGVQSTVQNVATGVQTGVQNLVSKVPGLHGLGQGWEEALAAGKATAVTIGTAILQYVLPAAVAALITGIFALLTGVITTQMKQSGVIPGTDRPGPDGSTDGNWINGKWYPRDTPKIDLKATLLSPPVIGAIIGGLFLLYTSQKRG